MNLNALFDPGDGTEYLVIPSFEDHTLHITVVHAGGLVYETSVPVTRLHLLQQMSDTYKDWYFNASGYLRSQLELKSAKRALERIENTAGTAKAIAAAKSVLDARH